MLRHLYQMAHQYQHQGSPSYHQQQQQQPQQQGEGQTSQDLRLDLPPPPFYGGQQNTEYPNPYGPPRPQMYYAPDHPSPGQPTHPHSHAHSPQTNSMNLPLPFSNPPQGTPSLLFPPTFGLDTSRQFPRGTPTNLTLSLPTSPYDEPSGSHYSMTYSTHPNYSPYATPLTGPPMLSASSTGSGGSGGMSEYFPPFPSLGTQIPSQAIPPPFPSPSWQSSLPSVTTPASAGPSTGRASHGPKTSRQQFTACGACRHRRVKCDLKDRQDQADRAAALDEERGIGPMRQRKKKVICTNCQERGTNCVDEFAPIKAAKQLRRGKRISEIEMLYGRNAATAAVTNEASQKAERRVREDGIPDLAPEFFQSAFFRRFQVQRPLLDPNDFVARYLSSPKPTAAALGPEGAVLCHVLYAWAVSYGVDERGCLDVPEGGAVVGSPTSLLEPNQDETKRETDRQVRWSKMKPVVKAILDEIDACGILRKPTWDGVRVLLLLLPLTEGVSTPVERLAMYESALSQAYMLCSHGAVGYDGQVAATSGASGGTDTPAGRELMLVRIRTYWYTFVHEGITTGLKGGRLHLDGDDMETMQDSISNKTLVLNSHSFRSASKLAVAPINLALACRLINRALTGPSARRRKDVNAEHVKEAWEALENCWEEFDSLRNTSPVAPYVSTDEVNHFVDGWKIFLFEAQNVIRNNLEERLNKLTEGQETAFISETSPDPAVNSDENSNAQISSIGHLLEIAKSKCDVKTRQIVDIVRKHVGGQMFEWDASLVRDGTYYAATLLAKNGGSDDDVAVCIRALNELRWAHAKAWERSADLRREWATSRSAHSNDTLLSGWDPHALPRGMMPPAFGGQVPPRQQYPSALQIQTHTSTPLSSNSMGRSVPRSHGTDSSLSNSPYTSPSIISPTAFENPAGQGVKHFPGSQQSGSFSAPSGFTASAYLPASTTGSFSGQGMIQKTSTPNVTPPQALYVSPPDTALSNHVAAFSTIGVDEGLGLGMGLNSEMGIDGLDLVMDNGLSQQPAVGEIPVENEPRLEAEVGIELDGDFTFGDEVDEGFQSFNL